MILVIAVVIVPVYTAFVQTGETTVRSETAYRAMMVAREEMQELRTMPLWGVAARPAVGDKPAREAVPPYTGHDWEPVAGKHVLHLSSSPEVDRAGLEGITYPEELYAGIETKAYVLAPSALAGDAIPEDHMDNQHLRVLRVEVRWQEKGEAERGGGLKVGTQLFSGLAVRRGVQ